MRINIGYFTSTNNTLWLCHKLKEMMEKQGHSVTLYEIIRDADKLSRDDCDLLGFLYPVWASNPPDPMRDYLLSMKEGNGKKVFFVGNCAAFTGDTGLRWKKILKKKGYDVYYLNHVIMPTNINIPYLPENIISKVPEGDKLRDALFKAEEKLPAICSSILRFEKRTEGRGPVSRLFGFLQRKFFWTANWYKSRFFVDKKRCINCGLCYRVCPVGNISINDKKEVSFGDKCILCVKCFNLCPSNAILICKRSIDADGYKRYKGPNREMRPVEYR